MRQEPSGLHDEQGHEYTETSGGNGWRFAGKVAAAVCAPLVIAIVTNLFVVGQWVGSITEKVEGLGREIEGIARIEERIRALELEGAARRGRDSGGVQPPSPGRAAQDGAFRP